MVSAGDWYLDKTNGRVYVVAQVGGHFTLINITTGLSYGGLHDSLKDVFLGDAQDFIKICKHGS